MTVGKFVYHSLTYLILCPSRPIFSSIINESYVIHGILQKVVYHWL